MTTINVGVALVEDSYIERNRGNMRESIPHAPLKLALPEPFQAADVSFSSK
jgi:hypothetical protein